jgi:hypothetical protein
VREERGQTAAEFMGLLFLTAAIIATIASTGFAGSVEQKAKEGICELASQDGCQRNLGPAKNLARRTQSTGPAVIKAEAANADRRGPPLGHAGPLNILPFPGSVQITCTGNGKEEKACLAGGKTGARFVAQVQQTYDRKNPVVDENGCPWTNFSLSTTYKLIAEGEAKGETVGAKLQRYLGHTQKYQATVSPADADAIAAKKRNPPNPLDPGSLANGESLQLSQEWYNGNGLKVNYEALQAEMGYDHGQRVSSGVKRVNDTTVRVYVGDEDFVREALKLGVSVKDFSIGVGNTKELSSGKLHSIDFEIDNSAGWNAYQRFIQTGKLPSQGTAGTVNPTRATTVRYTDSSEIQAKVFGVQFGGPLGSSEGRVTSTRNPNGSLTTISTARVGGIEIAYQQTQGTPPPGQLPDHQSLILDDVDPSLIATLYAREGKPAPANLSHTARIDLTDGQLTQLHDLAVQKVVSEIDARNGKAGPPSFAKIEQSLINQHGLRVFDGHTQYDFGGLEMLLGAAKDRRAQMAALFHGGITSAAVLQHLIDLPVGVQRNLPPMSLIQPRCRP